VRTVVDASVALKWYFDESGGSAADRLLEAYASGARDLVAPDLVVAEFANAIWKKVRRGECSPDAAGAILDLWEDDLPEIVPSAPLARRALDLAVALAHPVYDCLYLAAAIEYEAGFATADRVLARTARSVLASVELIE
jgi:predicted nucleic acid-binding protein